MPCRDGRDDIRTEYVDRKIHGLDIHDFEAILCGVLSAKGGNLLLGKVDWEEVGVSRTRVATWWHLHQEEDRRRRDRELAAAKLKATAAQALKKLTQEERHALGLVKPPTLPALPGRGR